MRSSNLVLCAALLLGGCAAGAGGSRGATLREHAGATLVLFTNATPAKMCELHMAFEDNKHMGDNWLPAGGLASGKSIEFKIRPGKYQATWSTCAEGNKSYFAGTLIGETGIGVSSQETQLFAYVADTVAPTKRAPVMGRDYQIVKFSGQPVGPIDRTAPAPAIDAFAVAEAQLARGKSAPPKVDPGTRFERFSAKDLVDPKAKRTASKSKGKRAKVRPSLDRKHDVAAANVKYRAR